MKNHFKISIAFLHGLLLFVILWCITNSSYTSNADEAILGKIHTIRQNIAGNKLNYNKKFLFVNVARDQKLMLDPEGYGDIAITDRSKLADLFKILADSGNQHYFTLCDIFFANPSDDDAAVATQIQRCKKLLFPYAINNDTLQQPCINVPSAVASFATHTGNFSKFMVQHTDSVKTVPLVLLNTLDQKDYHIGFPNFSAVLPRYYIQLPDLTSKKKYSYFNLGELLVISQTDSFYYKYLRDRFIVIGNFDTDVHNTPAGKMPGSLILLDIYLTLKNGGGNVSWWWVIFMIASLSGISYLLFFKKIKAPDIKKYPWVDLLMQLLVNKYISFSGICLLIIICSALIFNVQPNISPVLLYLLSVNFFIDFYKKHYKKEK